MHDSRLAFVLAVDDASSAACCEPARKSSEPWPSIRAAGGLRPEAKPTAASRCGRFAADSGKEETTVLETGVFLGSLQAALRAATSWRRGQCRAYGSFQSMAGGPNGFPAFRAWSRKLAFDSDGRRLAAGGGVLGDLVARGEAVVRVWDLDTREVRVLEPGDRQPIASCEFLPDGRLLTSGPAGVRLWDLATSTSDSDLKGAAVRARPSPDGRYVLVLRGELRPGGAVGTAFVYDLREKRSWDLTSHGTEVTSSRLAPVGQQVLTGSLDGIVRVGQLYGERTPSSDGPRRGGLGRRSGAWRSLDYVSRQ